MWAHWTGNQSSYILSNMQKDEMVTHVFDNIVWKNNNMQQTGTHYTNLILVQKCDTTEDLANISLEPKYDLDKKSTGLTKSSIKICLV